MNLNPKRIEIKINLIESLIRGPNLKNQKGAFNIPGGLFHDFCSLGFFGECQDELERMICGLE